MGFAFEDLLVYQKSVAFSKKEFKQFLYISRGSLYETITMTDIFKRKKWLEEEAYDKLYEHADEINRMLSGLITSLRHP